MDAQQPPQPPTNDDPPLPHLGRRAKLTHDALLVASNKVIKVLDDKAMRQCFPQRWADEYPDLIPGLKDMVVSTYSAGVPLAWDDLAQSADFIAKANALDSILADAQARKDRGEAPRELHRLGTDGTVTTPSATVPVLRSAIADLRTKREALAQKNTASYARLAALADRTTAQDAQNAAILSQFAETIKALEAIDQTAMLQLQDELVKVVGRDL
ncbi:hypothetical protein JCM10207_000841 [Rhodosporidiobolus poonsookiae]